MKKLALTFYKGTLGQIRRVGKYVAITDLHILTNLGDLNGNLVVSVYEMKDKEPYEKIRIFSIIDEFIPTKLLKKNKHSIALSTLLEQEYIEDILSIKIEKKATSIKQAFSEYKKFLKNINIPKKEINKNFDCLKRLGILTKG